MTMRILVADDERPARGRVIAMLASHADCEVIGEAVDGAQAADLILRDHPDLVLLDIRMPGLDGFEVLDALAAAGAPAPGIVFVTAHHEFALSAFGVGALDYLLKPFDQARFDRALHEARARIAVRRLGTLTADASGPIDAAVAAVLRSLGATPAFPARFLVRLGRQLKFVRADQIDWVEAEGNYVRLHLDGRTHLLRETLTAMQAKLDPAHFARVHRSAIVNIDRIAHIEPHVHGEYELRMLDGRTLTTSSAHGRQLRDLLRQS